jgi:D-alanyl-D-alanine carboxypeptidase
LTTGHSNRFLREKALRFCYCSQWTRTGNTTVVFEYLKKRRYRKWVSAIHDSLGIPPDYAARHRLPLQPETDRLCSIGPDIHDREQSMHPAAAESWHAMQAAARADGIELQVVSAYRSVRYQEGILRRKIEQGQSMDSILDVSAAPGYSEHHTGRALDLTTPGFAALEEAFEGSEAFAWLCENAGRFGFSLSFPRNNPHRIAYEPWHWAWSPVDV